jgi:hypothetical protein
VRKGEQSEFADFVRTSDLARVPADEMRKQSENAMAKLAVELPVFAWVKTVHGAGDLGLATIVAEAGDLANYPNPAKLWKRLGYAPYDGLAGSTWKRDTWRPRALTKEEWIENPFSGQRYALMAQIATWLVNAQWIGAKKTESGEGEPSGPYGEVYAARRAHTAKMHLDWTKGHSRNDGLRIAMKRFLLDLWLVWSGKEPKTKSIDRAANDTRSATVDRAAGHIAADAQRRNARRTKSPKTKSADQSSTDAQQDRIGRAAGRLQRDAQRHAARRTNSKSADQLSDDTRQDDVGRRRARDDVTPRKRLPAALIRDRSTKACRDAHK